MGVSEAGEEGRQRLGYPQRIVRAGLPKGPSLGFGGGWVGGYFARNLHINGVNARPGRSLWNLPGSCSLLCGFPTCLRASWLPVVWPRWGGGGGGFSCWRLASPGPTKGLPARPLGPHRPPAARGVPGRPPRGLVGGSRLAEGLPPLSLPERGARRESLGPSPARRGR